MSAFTLETSARAVLIGSAALIVTACSSNGSYRVASIGDVQSEAGTATGNTGSDGSGNTGTGNGNGSGGTTGTGTTGNGSGNGSSGGQTSLGSGVLVSAGNAVIGLAGKHNTLAGRVNGALPLATPVTGTVTAVLRDTGQTLVRLGSGQTVALNSVTGIVGEVIKLDLGSKTVISATDGSSLLGVGLLSPTAISGTLGSVNVGTGASTPASGVVGNVVGTVANVVNTPVAVVPAVTQVANNATGVLPAVTGVVGNVTGGPSPLNGIVAGAGALAGGSVGVTNGTSSAGATGVLGVNGLLGTPKR